MVRLQKNRLWPTFFYLGGERWGEGLKSFSILFNSIMWGFRFLSHCLHLPPTQQELQSAPFQIGRWKGWCLTYPETALAYAKSPRVRLTWFKKLLCISSLCFGWVAFEFFFSPPRSALPSFHESHLLILLHLQHLAKPFLKTWIRFTQFFVIFSPVKNQKSVNELNPRDVQSSRSVVFFLIRCDQAVFVIFPHDTDHRSRSVCLLSQHQVYRGGGGHRGQTRWSALALLKPRLRGQMLNTSNPISVSDLNRIRAACYLHRATGKRRVNAAVWAPKHIWSDQTKKTKNTPTEEKRLCGRRGASHLGYRNLL